MSKAARAHAELEPARRLRGPMGEPRYKYRIHYAIVNTPPSICALMSHSQSPLDIRQFQIWLELLMEHIRLKPAESFVIAAGVAFASYIIRRLTAASFYQNIDGPENSSFMYGTQRHSDKIT